MSLRVKVELQRSNRGIEMAKLERLSREAQRFLRSLADDLRIPSNGTWVAQAFYDQGIGFDATYQTADVDEIQANEYVHSLADVLTVDQSNDWKVAGVSSSTLVQSARLAKIAEDGETIRIGIYNGGPAVEWRSLVKSRAEAIIEHFDTTVRYRGMLQGVIHCWYAESEPPHFDLRDLATRALIKCYYTHHAHKSVHAGLARRSGVVVVVGWIEAKRSDQSIVRLDVDKIRLTDEVGKGEIERFFGAAPEWTGDMTTDDFIEAARRRDNGE